MSLPRSAARQGGYGVLLPPRRGGWVVAADAGRRPADLLRAAPDVSPVALGRVVDVATRLLSDAGLRGDLPPHGPRQVRAHAADVTQPHADREPVRTGRLQPPQQPAARQVEHLRRLHRLVDVDAVRRLEPTSTAWRSAGREVVVRVVPVPLVPAPGAADVLALRVEPARRRRGGCAGRRPARPRHADRAGVLDRRGRAAGRRRQASGAGPVARRASLGRGAAADGAARPRRAAAATGRDRRGRPRPAAPAGAHRGGARPVAGGRRRPRRGPRLGAGPRPGPRPGARPGAHRSAAPAVRRRDGLRLVAGHPRATGRRADAAHGGPAVDGARHPRDVVAVGGAGPARACWPRCCRWSGERHGRRRPVPPRACWPGPSAFPTPCCWRPAAHPTRSSATGCCGVPGSSTTSCVPSSRRHRPRRRRRRSSGHRSTGRCGLRRLVHDDRVAARGGYPLPVLRDQARPHRGAARRPAAACCGRSTRSAWPTRRGGAACPPVPRPARSPSRSVGTCCGPPGCPTPRRRGRRRRDGDRPRARPAARPGRRRPRAAAPGESALGAPARPGPHPGGSHRSATRRRRREEPSCGGRPAPGAAAPARRPVRRRRRPSAPRRPGDRHRPQAGSGTCGRTPCSACSPTAGAGSDPAGCRSSGRRWSTASSTSSLRLLPRRPRTGSA
nr:hypothetical protein [Angustibacter aerolatus]